MHVDDFTRRDDFTKGGDENRAVRYWNKQQGEERDKYESVSQRSVFGNTNVFTSESLVKYPADIQRMPLEMWVSAIHGIYRSKSFCVRHSFDVFSLLSRLTWNKAFCVYLFSLLKRKKRKQKMCSDWHCSITRETQLKGWTGESLEPGLWNSVHTWVV